MQERLRGDASRPTQGPATSPTAELEISIGRERHHVSVRNGRIWLCSDNCGALIDKLNAMLGDIPANHSERVDFEKFLGELRRLESRRADMDPIEFDLEVRHQGRQLEALLEITEDPALAAMLLEKHPLDLDELFDGGLDLVRAGVWGGSAQPPAGLPADQ